MGGWVKLYRKALDNPVVCKDADHLAIWIYLLLSATHTPIERVFNGEKIILQPGQLIRCTATISSKLRVSNSKVNRVLKCFESDKQIERLTKRHGTLFTLLNWSDYQSNEKPNEELMEDQWKTTERPVETNKKLRSKEHKKKDIREFIPPSLQEIKDYTNEKQLVVEPEFFFNYFTANNWVDSKNNEVKSWKQKMLTWDKNERAKNPKPKVPTNQQDFLKGIVKNGG